MGPEEAALELREDLILLDLDAGEAGEAIAQLAQLLLAAGCVRDSYPGAVIEREIAYPTGLPTPIPVALPHTGAEHCLRPALAFARLRRPVGFAAMGDPSQILPVRLVFMLSVTDPNSQVAWLKRLVDLCQDREGLHALLTATEPGRVLAELRSRLAMGEPERGVRQTLLERATPSRVIITVGNPEGLHARPATLFVETASRFPCSIRVANLSRASPFADAKSILGVLSLGVRQGDEVVLEAEGDAATEALAALQRLVEAGFQQVPHSAGR
jgi:PTS system galactitol-specific IIA component